VQVRSVCQIVRFTRALMTECHRNTINQSQCDRGTVKGVLCTRSASVSAVVRLLLDSTVRARSERITCTLRATPLQGLARRLIESDHRIRDDMQMFLLLKSSACTRTHRTRANPQIDRPPATRRLLQ